MLERSTNLLGRGGVSNSCNRVVVPIQDRNPSTDFVELELPRNFHHCQWHWLAVPVVPVAFERK